MISYIHFSVSVLMNSFMSHFFFLLSLLLGRQLKTFYITEALVLSWYFCALSQEQEKKKTLQIVVQLLFK